MVDALGNCQQFRIAKETFVSFAGYTVSRSVIVPGISVSILILTPEGRSIVQGVAYVQTPEPHWTTYTHTTNSVPDFSFTVIDSGYDGNKLPWAQIKLCVTGGGDGSTVPVVPTGPQLSECVFPELSLNFIAVMSGLASWLGCMVRNIIVLIQWIVDWILHFGDHLDAWISRLFGVDPSLPFFDEVMKKIDVWISGKFGVDPDLPFWEELIKKAIGWLSDALDEASRKATERLK